MQPRSHPRVCTPLWLCPGAVLAASPRAELRPGSPDVVPAEGGPLVFWEGGTVHRGNMYMCMLLQCTFCCQLTTS